MTAPAGEAKPASGAPSNAGSPVAAESAQALYAGDGSLVSGGVSPDKGVGAALPASRSGTAAAAPAREEPASATGGETAARFFKGSDTVLAPPRP
jgi:hypothetical protein